jgi:lysophospholipid acyltransferase (LPLAT)-like uncharacterized protein
VWENTDVNAAATPEISAGRSRRFTLRQRAQLWLITWAGFLVIRVIGPTLRFAVSCEEGAPDPLLHPPLVYAFWHRCVIPAAWLWRRADISVMTSRSFDGEYIARIIGKLGFVAVRGSSSRGGTEGLRQMARESDEAVAAFTADGPRGPKYVAKHGPVLLARLTGAPLAAFHIALEKAWVLNTWDKFMIPKPFSRALVRVSSKILVPADCDGGRLEEFHRLLQASLDRVRQFAEENVSRAGNKEFPLYKREDL